MQTVDQVLDIFSTYRSTPTPNDVYDVVGKRILREKMLGYMDNNMPISFVMLGFPFKSTNERDKVLGKLPDLGEQATLENFSRFNSEIKSVYTPGVDINIVSDGHIFNDVLGVTDTLVDQYREISMDMGKNAPIQWYSLADFYSGRSLKEKREKVMTQFGVSEEVMQREILLNPDTHYLYMGMIRFMEEELADKNFSSRNQLHKAAKQLVRQMMMRNEAYSNLVRNEFQNYIRLSMHPSINNGSKYSFRLIPGNTPHSAWHSAVVVDEATKAYSTMHKKDAIEKGYELVHSNGQPFYFIKKAA